MTTSSWEPRARKIATNSIAAHQTYISSRKGLDCSDQVLYGNKSRPDDIKNILTQQSLILAVKSPRQRFKGCSAASQMLKTKQILLFGVHSHPLLLAL